MGLAVCAAPVAIAADADSGVGVGAICSAEQPQASAGGERTLVMVPGVGTGGFAIATAKPEAQAWFNYGMALAHAFYHDDAILAFKRARDIDPGCAMCAWGEAWSEGPTINYDIDPAERRAAGGVADRAAALGALESPKNRALIDALRLRYSGPGQPADTAFARAMDALSRRYADDDEIAIMTSDAWLMLAQQHGDSQGVARAVAVLEPVLARHPDNTGAIHFYIHATEIAGDPARALPFADRLGALAPGASHLVHMASHTFFRVGRYEDAAVVNAQAIGVDGAYLRASHDATIQGRVRYHAHDLRFGLAGAMASGDAPLALRLADHQAYAFPNSIATEGGSQVTAAGADVAYGRFAPARALALTDPGPKAPFAAAFRHYARGEAYAALGDAAEVTAEAGRIEAVTGAAEATPGYFQKSARAILRIAVLTLRGRAAMLRGQPKAAEAFYRNAVTIQDADLSFKGAFDPPPWWYPERRSLAAAQLAADDQAGAAETARAALKTWPREPLTLEVLGRAEAATGQAARGARDLAEAARTWRGGSISLARM
jgi:tetratricopeptide (TPR) repeat protein